MNEKPIGVCGLKCFECPAHLAMKRDDQGLRERTAAEWNVAYAAFGANFAPADINCVGCGEEGVHSGYCCACPVRTCALAKGLANCHVCPEFAGCDTRKGFEANGIDIAKNFAAL